MRKNGVNFLWITFVITEKKLRHCGGRYYSETMLEVKSLQDSDQKSMNKEMDKRIITKARSEGKCGASYSAGKKYLTKLNLENRKNPKDLGVFGRLHRGVTPEAAVQGGELNCHV